uniref:Uncharacterized protein n=1 Tax=Solanum tuberosum TaxID=4113 RepID=M0ZTL8_SOLTU
MKKLLKMLVGHDTVSQKCLLYHTTSFYFILKKRDPEASQKCFNFHHSDEDLVSTLFVALGPQKTPYSVYSRHYPKI